MAGKSYRTSCGHAGLCDCAEAAKLCSSCGDWLPKDVTHFYVYASGYLSSRCRPCSVASAQRWNRTHPDAAQAHSWDWYFSHQQAATQARVAWREDHPERDRAARDRYEARHPNRSEDARARMTPEQRAQVAAAKKAWRARTRDTTRLVEIRNAERRRARLTSTAYEDIDRRAVFERHHGACQVCGEAVDPTIPWPDPLFASIDHILLVAHGGPTTMTNVRLAHLRCNQGRPRTIREASSI